MQLTEVGRKQDKVEKIVKEEETGYNEEETDFCMNTAPKNSHFPEEEVESFNEELSV